MPAGRYSGTKPGQARQRDGQTAREPQAGEDRGDALRQRSRTHVPAVPPRFEPAGAGALRWNAVGVM